MWEPSPASGVQREDKVSSEGPDDALLIRRCLAGEVEAFSDLVRRYQDRVYNAMVRVCGNEDDALEVTQDAFVKAYRSLGSFRGGSAFYTWIYRIAMNTAISRKRRSGKVVFLPMGSSSEGEEGNGAAAVLDPPAKAENPSAALEQAEIRERVERALTHVPEDLRQAMVLRDMEGLSYEEVAEALALAVGTVKSRIHRARVILREHLEDLL